MTVASCIAKCVYSVTHGTTNVPTAMLGNSEPAAPNFTIQPSNQTVVEGGTATFTSLASGFPTPTYQWQVDSGGGFGNITGATNRVLVLSAVDIGDDGNEYRCIATNTEGSDTSDVATLTVNELAGIGTMAIGSTFEVS